MKSALVRWCLFVLVAGFVFTTATVAVLAAPPRSNLHTDCPASSTCSPSPSPIPVNAFIALDVSAGNATTQITVSGGSFFPGEAMAIDWDNNTSQVIGSATADAGGNFGNVKVKPFAGAAPGLHLICASVAPKPCAQFDLEATASPSPSPSASPSESPSPTESPSPSESPTPSVIPVSGGSSPNNLDVLLKPPFVFLPFIAALGLVGAIAYWAFGSAARRRPVVPPLPSASVVHRSSRPGQSGLPGIEYTPPSVAEPIAPAEAEPEPFTPEELQPPWPSIDRPPSEEEPPDSPRD